MATIMFFHVVRLADGNTLTRQLTFEQASGHACVGCGRSNGDDGPFFARRPMVPVGTVCGAQVFAHETCRGLL